jgi:parvulin-like peptidyl-prolyl isomerase
MKFERPITKMKLKLFLSAALAVGVISAHAATQNAAPPAGTNSSTDAMTALFGDPVIAKGKSFEIKRSELDQVLTGAKANAAAQGQQLPPDFEIQILNQLIYIQLLQQKATDADRAAGQKEADVQFTNILTHFGSQEALQRQLTAVGMTMEQLRAKAVQEAVAKAALRRELNITTTDAEAMDYFTNHPSEFESPETVHVRHILLLTMDPATRTPLSADQVAAKRKSIDDLLKRVKAGEDFAKLATQYSEDPGSKEKGGELDAFPRGQMVPEFEAAAFSLATNQVSDVVTTSYGFHIIKVLDKSPAKKVALADKVPSSDLTVADELKDALTRQKVAKSAPDYVEKLKKETGVEIVDPNLKASSAALEAAMTNAPAVLPDK